MYAILRWYLRLPIHPDTNKQAVIPSELLFVPTPQRPWYWQNFEKFYPYYQRLLMLSLKTLVKVQDAPVKVGDLFRGALGVDSPPPPHLFSFLTIVVGFSFFPSLSEKVLQKTFRLRDHVAPQHGL